MARDVKLYSPMPRRPTRLATFSYRGRHRYFLTFCTADRRPHFLSADIVEPVKLQILRMSNEVGFAVLAYCFMPDHLHLLVEGLEEVSDLRRFVARTKQSTGHWFVARRRQRLWQRYYYERVLRRSDDIAAVVRYIAANPVRAGIVDVPLEYPFTGSMVYDRAAFVDAFFRSG